MGDSAEQAQVEALHNRYFEALGSGDMDQLADCFTFPAAFKGFLDDVTLATDKASLIATYQDLIAAAPKATRTELLGKETNCLRPGVYNLTMRYKQYGADDTLIHEGCADYFFKRVGNGYRLFAVF